MLYNLIENSHRIKPQETYMFVFFVRQFNTRGYERVTESHTVAEPENLKYAINVKL